MLSTIIALALQGISLGTGLWSAALPMDTIRESSTDTSLIGDMAQSGYQSGISASVEKDTTFTERQEEGGLKKTLGLISKFTGIGAAIAGSVPKGGTKPPISGATVTV